MKFQIVTPGKIKQPFIATGESEYIKRINQIGRIEVVEVRSSTKGGSTSDIVEAEGQLILRKANPGAVLIALDEQGKAVTSQELATLFEKEFTAGFSAISFVIGGPFGLSPQVKNNAKHILSLSALTFTAQFARLILVEQIYRALAIRNGLPYHKE